jgi:transcriptional regulator with XRE-family HTH domain
MHEKSLAQFIQEKREKLGLSASGLAKKCHLELELIEQIESGQELFLPTTIRQNLAKGIKCSPDEIKAFEISFDNNFVEAETIDTIKQKILNGEKGLICPKCRSLLITRVAKMYDLEDNLMLHPKARCSKCVFQIKD